MNLLLDSHVLLWSYFDPTRLTPVARTHLTDPSNKMFVSGASHWEIAIKIGSGKLQITESFADFIQHAVFDNGFAFLPVEPHHSALLISLPMHHRDPFDRMIVAQALAEGMQILSADTALDAYPIQRIW